MSPIPDTPVVPPAEAERVKQQDQRHEGSTMKNQTQVQRLSRDASVAVRERPVLMSGPMVRAILDGTKTQTRRVVKGEWADSLTREVVANEARRLQAACECPYGQSGDRLYVRETHLRSGEDVMYADHDDYDICYPTRGSAAYLWRVVPSIHMRREDSRLTLELTGVRVEHVQDITDDGAEAEGVATLGGRLVEGDYRRFFRAVWNNLNYARGYGWGVNPWVWVLSFRRVEP